MFNRDKILIIGPYTDKFGGITTFIHNLVDIDDENFLVYSNHRSTWVKVNNILLQKIQKLIISLLNNIKFIYKIIISYSNVSKVMVVTSSNFGFWDSIFYVIISKITGKKVVLRYAGDIQFFYNNSNFVKQKVITLCLRLPDLLLVQSESIIDYIKEKISAHLRCVALPEIIMNIQENINPINETRNVIFFGGYDAYRKGLAEVLETIEMVNQRKNNFYFYLVAIPLEEQQRLELLDYRNVEVIGYVQGKEKEELMKKINILLLPSYKEGLPNAILDALSYGIPVITTRVGSIPNILEDYQNAVFVKIGNSEDLAEKLALFENKEFLKNMAIKNLELAQMFYKDNFIKKFDEMMHAI